MCSVGLNVRICASGGRRGPFADLERTNPNQLISQVKSGRAVRRHREAAATRLGTQTAPSRWFRGTVFLDSGNIVLVRMTQCGLLLPESTSAGAAGRARMASAWGIGRYLLGKHVTEKPGALAAGGLRGRRRLRACPTRFLYFNNSSTLLASSTRSLRSSRSDAGMAASFSPAQLGRAPKRFSICRRRTVSSPACRPS